MSHKLEDVAAGREPGRAFAYIGTVAGVVISVWANVTHAELKTDQIAARAIAGAWPIALFIAVEIVTRVRWRTPAIRAVATGGFGVVAFGAFGVSYAHFHGLFTEWHEPMFTRYVGPLVFDGLMVGSAAALYIMRRPSAPTIVTREMPAEEPEGGAEWPQSTESTVLSVEAIDRPKPSEETEKSSRPHVPRVARSSKSRATQSTNTEGLDLVAQAVAAELHRKGETVTHRTLAAGIRSRGYSVSNTRASELLKQLRGNDEPATRAAG